MFLKIDKKKRVLLLHSEITKKFEWFLDFLKNNERITDKLVSTLPKDKQDFIEYISPDIVKQAKEEWERDLSKPIGQRYLQICGWHSVCRQCYYFRARTIEWQSEFGGIS